MKPQQDNTTNEKPTKGKSQLFAIVLGIVMVAIYMGMAFLLGFTNFFIGKMPEWLRLLMAGVFFVYGVFRGYRVYSSMRE